MRSFHDTRGQIPIDDACFGLTRGYWLADIPAAPSLTHIVPGGPLTALHLETHARKFEENYPHNSIIGVDWQVAALCTGKSGVVVGMNPCKSCIV